MDSLAIWKRMWYILADLELFWFDLEQKGPHLAGHI